MGNTDSHKSNSQQQPYPSSWDRHRLLATIRIISLFQQWLSILLVQHYSPLAPHRCIAHWQLPAFWLAQLQSLHSGTVVVMLPRQRLGLSSSMQLQQGFNYTGSSPTAETGWPHLAALPSQQHLQCSHRGRCSSAWEILSMRQ